MARIILTLLCLWSCIVTVTPLTEDQVKRATDYIRKHFNPNEANQYAYAVVFSKQDLLSLNGEKPKILPNEIPNEIANAVRDDKVTYTGRQMVLARAKDGKTNKKIHSEYRLLFPPTGSSVSPVQDIVNKNPSPASAIFYTLNSPCVERCVKPDDQRNIIEKLEVFKKYNNNINNINKAFVYNKLYSLNVSKIDEIWDGLMRINAHMDVYRCFDGKCLRCFDTSKNTYKNKDFCVGKKKKN
ncbi:uncharacterized protein LOC120936087 [Rana temporaria]|uniref:uncharacterized protein LOC120936087 n=1 Tax=Rana temporaria TaxID=8407 RepID=UPI001AAC9394|nr:uncharacterized protein LOC120936087 [Rana temporaria]